MKIKKRKFKLWIVSMLAISAATFSTSLILSSCTTTNKKNESVNTDIVINNQPSDNQEVSTDSTSNLTLTINATSTEGKTLTYQWYVNKNSSANPQWEKIAGATSSTYSVPTSEFKDLTETTTWQYKAEIQHSDNLDVKLTSNVYSVKFTPPTNTTPPTTPDPDPPVTPPTTPDPTPPVTPTPPETPNPPTTPEEPSVPEEKDELDVPASEYKEIQARANDYKFGLGNKYGLTTVRYNQEKWIGDNSVSISFSCKPNIDYVKRYLDKYIAANSSATSGDSLQAYRLARNFRNVLSLNDSTVYSVYTTYNGTGWILDYSTDSSNSNLVNYYIATNIHVIEAAYTISYGSSLTLPDGTETTAGFSASIPFSAESINSLDVYITQPQYNETNAKYNGRVPIYDRTAWYKTSINVNNFQNSLINLGSYSSDASQQLKTPYALQLTYEYVDKNNKDVKESVYYEKNQYVGTKNADKVATGATDFGVLKLTESKTAFDNYSSWTTVFKKMQTMFKVETDDSKVTRRSSYISRLNALLTMLKSNNYNKETVDNLFMFADYNKDFTNTTTLSTAGFPLSTDRNATSYSDFNSNTMSYSLSNAISERDDVWRENIGYNSNGSLYYSNYDWKNDRLLANVVLLGGASGGMSVTQKYKIGGIYWGTLTYENETPEKYGIISKLYSQTDESSVIKVWLKYVAKTDPNSKLLELFTGLEAKGYFS